MVDPEAILTVAKVIECICSSWPTVYPPSTLPPSQQSTKAYVDNKVAPLANPIQAWCVFNGTGTPAVISGSNVASITDNGTGDYTINFTSALANTNYAVFATATDGSARYVHVTSKATGSVTVNARAVSGATVDVDEINFQVLGA